MTVLPEIVTLAAEVELDSRVRQGWAGVDAVARRNHEKVLDAFREVGVNSYYLTGSTGYGYGDMGREGLDRLFARVFGGEAGLVRPHIVSGTHALALCLFGVLRPGDNLLGATGPMYDTLQEITGNQSRGCSPGSLAEWGITSREVDLTPGGHVDLKAVQADIGSDTRMVFIQRSCGYSWRPSLTVADIAAVIQAVKEVRDDIVCLVDNCYGEFVEELEPGDVGADLLAGSLIKNPGGGLAPTGGYVVGKANLVARAARQLTAPGLGSAVGATLDTNRLFYQGLFLAPHVVAEALKSAVFAAELMQRLGFRVHPETGSRRGDIIQAVAMEKPERLLAFCRGIQKGSPVDSEVVPEPWAMPGYGSGVIMAAGTFIQGASLELSADAPMKPPYAVYLQGGLSREYARLGLLHAIQELWEAGELKLGPSA